MKRERLSSETPEIVENILRVLAREPTLEAATRDTVAEVLSQVRVHGLSAALAYGRRFDHAAVTESDVRVTSAQMEAGYALVQREQPELLAALGQMIVHVERFAQSQRDALTGVHLALAHGGSVGERWVPLSRVGVYVPGGRAFYPSTLVMTVVPAKIAGVGRIVAVTPPQASGLDPVLLCTAKLLGVDELYTLGGAQAIGWLAFGEPQVDLIAGPGNRFVAEAKRQLVGTCGIDSVAGPTEVLIVADQSADPSRVAEDLLAQAEHDPEAAAVLASTSGELLHEVQTILHQRIITSPRSEIVRESLDRYGFLLEGSRSSIIDFAQRWAPEHLELVVREPEPWLAALTTASAVFVGSASAEAFGDYGAGPNHVLPTGRSARYSSPLGVATYMKRQSILQLSEADAKAMAPWVSALAAAERLYHHGESAKLRG
jgi:histidinol dehydrogenase